MKLCFIDWFAHGLFKPKSKIVFGGAQIQLYLLANEMAKSNQFEVCFLTDNQRQNRREVFNKISVYQLVRSPKNSGIKGRLLTGYWYFFLRLLIQLRKINADVYIQRAASAETGLIALICRLLRKKFIYMVAHTQDVDGSFGEKNGWRGRLYLLGLRRADKIICQTDEQQKKLDKKLQVKSVVIPSGYPIRNKKLAKKQGILWVARAEAWKQPEMFISLAKKFPQEKFTMICPPAENNPAYFLKVKSLAESRPNLNFIKQVPFSEINAYFSRSKILISTSLSEGFPNTFIQAGLNRVPIISYKINPDNIIGRFRIGYCANGDLKQLEKHLRRVLTNERLRLRLGFNVYNYVRDNHDIKQTVAGIIAHIGPRQFSKNNVDQG